MHNRKEGDIPRLWRNDLLPPTYPEDSWQPIDPALDSLPQRQQSSWVEWIARLSPSRMLGYGCIVIVVLSAAMVYCVGAAAFLVRPALDERAAITPTEVVRATMAPTPTQEIKPTLIQLPPGRLVATPTQAPIPTREPPTITPTVEMVNGMTVTPTPTPTGRVSPTRKPGAAPTAKP